VKVLGVMVSILGTPCYDTKLVYILLKQLKFKIVLKHVKEGVFVLLNAAYMHPVSPVVTLF
jgi:hypothetical protein